MTVATDTKTLRLCAFKAEPEVNELQRLVSGMVSTTDVDMVGDVVLPEGCDTETYFKTTRNVDLEHDANRPVGKNVNMKVHPGKGIWTLTHVGTHQLGQDVFTMLREGTLPGLSIEWDPRTLFANSPTADEIDRYGMCKRVFRRWTMTSYAFTARPCNPKCVVDGIKSATWAREQEDIWEAMRDLVDRRAIKAASAVAAGLPIRFLRRSEVKRLPEPLILSAPEPLVV